MALVTYSESESDSNSEPEAPLPNPPPTSTPTIPSTSKKPAFQKVIDRFNGKIIVNLNAPSSSSKNPVGSDSNPEPPSKRARTSDGGGGGGGLFKGFNAFLPPPKNNSARSAASIPIRPSSKQQTPRPGIHLKTSADVGFSRGSDDLDGSRERDGDGIRARDGDGDGDGGGMGQQRAPQPSVSAGLKPASEVKLVGKPLMFKPLSVARNTKKKPKPTLPPPPPAASSSSTSASTSSIHAPTDSSRISASRTGPATTPAQDGAPPAAPRRSLFSLHVEDPPSVSVAPQPSSSSSLLFSPSSAAAATSSYEPLFSHLDPEPPQPHHATHPDVPMYDPSPPQPQDTRPSSSLHAVADELNLSAAARRELFGRAGPSPSSLSRSASGAGASASVLTFNMDQEYRHNETLRAAGEQQLHNPVRAIQGGGKHSLRQLVHNVVNQREALEDSFAKGKSNRKEASSKYGW